MWGNTPTVGSEEKLIIVYPFKNDYDQILTRVPIERDDVVWFHAKVRCILRPDSNAVPIELTFSDSPGSTRPSTRQSKEERRHRAPAVSGCQIISTANRTGSCRYLVESYGQAIQRSSALQISQLITMSSKIRAGGATRAVKRTHTASSMTAEMQ